ncbi:MAG: cyclin-like protein [Piptocephalis tieghemiana]|nr:MAG: cyclin-like protein [Piptocephalis tieghemiana]
MSADYWASSHFLHWTLDKRQLALAAEPDLERLTPEEILRLHLHYTNIIQSAARKMHLRQRVTSTAHVYYRRFYAKNALRDTDPSLIMATSLFLACKAEESPHHLRTVVNEVRHACTQLHSPFIYSDADVAIFEAYLLDQLACHLTIHHPYRSLTRMSHHLRVSSSDLQVAWYLLNDLLRTHLPLLYPPHSLAAASLLLVLAPSSFSSSSSSSSSSKLNPTLSPSSSSVSSSSSSSSTSSSSSSSSSSSPMMTSSSSSSSITSTSAPSTSMHSTPSPSPSPCPSPSTTLLSASSSSSSSSNPSSTPPPSSKSSGPSPLTTHPPKQLTTEDLIQWFAHLNVETHELTDIVHTMQWVYQVWAVHDAHPDIQPILTKLYDICPGSKT